MEHILNNLFLNGYNLINTTLYTFVVFISAIIFYKVLKHLKIEINRKFIYSVLSFVFLGSLLRILEQEYTGVWLIKHSNSPLELGFYFHTPGWLLLIAFIFLISFFFSILLFKERYYRLLIPLGLLFSFPLLIYQLIHISHLSVLLFCVITILFFYFLILEATKIFNRNFFQPLENKLILLSQLIDSFATFFGIYFFKNILYEQHPVSRALILISPILFPIVKVLLSILFIVVIDKTIEDKQERTYIKLIIIVLGFLTGVRDILTISLLL